MFTITSYVIFWTLVFFMLGVVWYVLDRMYGVKLYPLIYKWGHENPLPENSDIGFVYNQRTRVQVAAAALVSTIQSIMTLSTDINPLAEFIMWIVEVPITLLGFICGPFAFRLWKDRDGLFDTIDRVKNKEIDIQEKVADLRADVSNEISDTASQAKSFLASLWDRSLRAVLRKTILKPTQPKNAEEVK